MCWYQPERPSWREVGRNSVLSLRSVWPVVRGLCACGGAVSFLWLVSCVFRSVVICVPAHDSSRKILPFLLCPRKLAMGSISDGVRVSTGRLPTGCPPECGGIQQPSVDEDDIWKFVVLSTLLVFRESPSLHMMEGQCSVVVTALCRFPVFVQAH